MAGDRAGVGGHDHRVLVQLGDQRHAVLVAGRLGFERITLEADPGAEPFYLAMGARRIGSVPSGSIPGRFIPLLDVPNGGVEER
jgi:hypothetical protein